MQRACEAFAWLPWCRAVDCARRRVQCYIAPWKDHASVKSWFVASRSRHKILTHECRFACGYCVRLHDCPGQQHGLFTATGKMPRASAPDARLFWVASADPADSIRLDSSDSASLSDSDTTDSRCSCAVDIKTTPSY